MNKPIYDEIVGNVLTMMMQYRVYTHWAQIRQEKEHCRWYRNRRKMRR